MNRYMARFDFGAKCGSPSLLTPDLACGLGPDAKARSSNPALAKRLASAAQPSTFPLRPRNWRRDSEANHSFLSPEGTGKSIGVIGSSQSLHSGCCFIEAFNPYLFIHRLIQVEHFACNHRPGCQLRIRNRMDRGLFAGPYQSMSILRICGVLFLHVTKRLLEHRGHLRGRNPRQQNQAHAIDSFLWTWSSFLNYTLRQNPGGFDPLDIVHCDEGLQGCVSALPPGADHVALGSVKGIHVWQRRHAFHI